MIRQADVYFRDILAGRLIELADGGYRFSYDQQYLDCGEAISLTLPLQEESFETEVIPSFFAGLVPEGWFLSIASSVLAIDEHDIFGLLMHTCGDCIGAVSLRAVGEDHV